MALIPRIANLNTTIPLAIGTGAGLSLLTGYEQWFGQGYGAVASGISSDLTGVTDMLTSMTGGNTTAVFVSEFLWGVGISQSLGGYNNGNFVIALPPSSFAGGDGIFDWQVGFYPQDYIDGINPTAPGPTLSVIAGAVDCSGFTIASSCQGITNIAGLSVSSLVSDIAAGEMYIMFSDFATLSVENAFQLEVGEISFPYVFTRTGRWIYTNPDFWLIYTSDLGGVLTLVNFTPQPFGGGFSATKYSMTFDDATLNASLIAGDYELAGINDQGFMIQFLNQVGSYANTRVIYMAFDGLTYDEYILSGDAATEANLLASTPGLSIDNLGQVFMMGIDSVTFDASVFSPYIPFGGTPIFTRNSQGVKLECGNYCIPLLKQRK